MTLKANDERAPDEPPEGSWWMKVSLHQRAAYGKFEYRS